MMSSYVSIETLSSWMLLLYNMFRQAFLLSQFIYFICVQYFEVQTYNIRNIFLTVDCFNNIVFILVAKISFKRICEKIQINSTWKNVLVVWNKNAELLRLVGATFDSKVAFIRTMRKENLIILNSLQKKKFAIFDIWVVKSELIMFGKL